MVSATRRFQNVLKFDHITKDIQNHIKLVYSTLAISLLMAAAGAYIQLITQSMGSIVFSLLSLGLMMAIFIIPHKRENTTIRFLCLLGVAFFTGVSLTPLIRVAYYINPEIIPSAFFGSAVIFICFSMAALFNKNRTFIYLGGALFSALSILMIGQLVNFFVRSNALFTLELYLGFGIFTLFILFDTQLMIEKRRAGDDDFIHQSLDLFIDFIEVFRMLIIILSRKEERNRRDD